MTTAFPLRTLFEQLRKTGFRLTIDQYHFAVEALTLSIADGLDPTNIDAVKHLCQTVWVKSPEEQRRFEKFWQALIPKNPDQIPPTLFRKGNDGESSNVNLEANTQLENTDNLDNNNLDQPEEYLTFETPNLQVGTAISVNCQEGYYFPVSRQQLREGWETFKPQRPKTFFKEIDIPATVEQITKDGFFIKPVFAPTQTLEIPPKVLLLLDQKGSMAPFHPLCRHWVNLWSDATVYYFHNCPTDSLYLDPQLRKGEDIETVLTQFSPKNTVALIISDAGAAKQRSVPDRWDETVEFLNLLTDTVSRVAWLNPLPRHRWLDTTAEDIAKIYPKQVPMFALDPAEYQKMLRWLRWGDSNFNFNSPLTNESMGGSLNWDFDATSRINSFTQQYGNSYLNLASHAAFPLTLTPDLLYRLWKKFLVPNYPELELPWYAVADILLSDFCQPVEEELIELYEIEPDIRNQLLIKLTDQEGEQRLKELSDFIIEYLKKQLKSTLPHWLGSLYERQQWAALAYTDQQDEAVQQLAKSLKKAYLQNNKSELVQWSELAQTISSVLTDKKYQPLLIAAKGYGAEARGIRRETENAQRDWEQYLGQEEIVTLAGVELAKPGSVLGRLPLKRFSFKTVTVNKKGEIINRETKQARYFTEDLGNGITLDMVYIPGGTFLMGSPEGKGDKNEYPQHQVTIPPFFMGKYSITQAQWKAVANWPKIQRDLDPDHSPSRFKGDNKPIERVEWNDAVEFCARLLQRTERPYRLPSEAQWEYACRARTQTPFYFGETLTSDLANYDGTVTYADEPKGKFRGETTSVGKFPPNAFGLYDLHGNVWDWCADPWHDNYEGAPTGGEVWDEENGNNNHYQIYSAENLVNLLNDERSHCLRGGSWVSVPGTCRSAIRNWYAAINSYNYNGFRVCWVVGAS
ncbi:SUMF1/EgtB/PvdO family nonheme iron enzyme [Planktothrix paucivesiculata]|uniref:von Willebrand factor A domain-containing protein n=1 Tax=Planktothrix paucivesiculata PCC 9631 TaxID=671071 RepID=A0A7Z9C0R2_9CYAN|nr:SUMF1/EgtB/PvdO family nonheme iron enzyme [Planktothrix paucivesiculata]VXD25193.1 von Willebrand factor A domain-containing protein [Planktothrix paucivesiculata PCC 9631]